MALLRSRFVCPGLLLGGLGVVLALAGGCSKSHDRPGPAGSLGGSGGTAGTGSGTGGTGTGGSATGGTGAGGSATGGTGTGGSATGGASGSAAGGGSGASGAGGTGGIADAGPPSCSTFNGFGTEKFTAVGRTPKKFAKAFNAEVKNGSGPAPGTMLMVVKYDAKQLWLGPPRVAGGGYAFGYPYAGLSFATSPDLQIQPATPTSFAIAVNSVRIPIAWVSMRGHIKNNCQSFVVDSLTLDVPASASYIAFHGSTIGALMGEPQYIGPLVDGGSPVDVPDSGLPGSGSLDSGLPDSGSLDSGLPDSGPPDSGPPEGGPDGGVPPMPGWYLDLKGTATVVSYQGGPL